MNNINEVQTLSSHLILTKQTFMKSILLFISFDCLHAFAQKTLAINPPSSFYLGSQNHQLVWTKS
jgi:hypothetical protein